MTTQGKGKGKSSKGAQKTTPVQKKTTRTPRTSKKIESAPVQVTPVKDHSAKSDVYRNIPPANYRLQGLRVTVSDKGDGTIVKSGKNDSGKYEIVVCMDSDHSEVTTKPSDPTIRYYRVGVQKPDRDLYYSDRLFSQKKESAKIESAPAKKNPRKGKKTTQKTESAPATPAPAKKTTRKGKSARAKYAGKVRATPPGSLEVKSGSVVPAKEVTIPMVEPVKTESAPAIKIARKSPDDSKFADVSTDSHIPGRTVKSHGKMGLSPTQKTAKKTA